MNTLRTDLRAGGAALDITPGKSMFLRGYPHVERYSTGTLDPLMVSALYLDDGDNSSLFLANDVIYVTRETTARIRERIERETGIPGRAIQISATHTHSGPMTGLSAAIMTGAESEDGVDPEYIAFWEDRMAEAATLAKARAVPAKAGLAVASAEGLGTNRHDPAGPSDLQLPVLGVRARDGGRWIAAMAVCNIHPTVLHEDSTLYSGDFPGQAREILRSSALGADCPFLYHNGASGDQSPRHVTKSNTPEEARRLGGILASAVAGALPTMAFRSDVPIAVARTTMKLAPRRLPSLAEAEAALAGSARSLQSLRDSGAARTDVRTAECDWFGAEKTVALARADASGELDRARARAQPAEISVARIGDWKFVFWPGEWFVEYGLAIKVKSGDTFVITCANGETQGYIATEEGVQKKRYEATNAVFCHTNGPRGVQQTLELLTGP